jgi:hypothetical protein
MIGGQQYVCSNQGSVLSVYDFKSAYLFLILLVSFIWEHLFRIFYDRINIGMKNITLTEKILQQNHVASALKPSAWYTWRASSVNICIFQSQAEPYDSI